jgi:multiple sugar transport system permease protein
MAGSTLAVLPIIVVYLAAQRYFVEGIQLTGLGGR